MLSTLASWSLESDISNFETKIKVYPYFVTLERFIESDDQTRSFMSAIFQKIEQERRLQCMKFTRGKSQAVKSY